MPLVKKGTPPAKTRQARGKMNACLDIGPSTVTIVGETAAYLEKLCQGVEQPWRKLRPVQRALTRSRRATNPDNFNEYLTVKKGA